MSKGNGVYTLSELINQKAQFRVSNGKIVSREYKPKKKTLFEWLEVRELK